jgi:hypothetical protein
MTYGSANVPIGFDFDYVGTGTTPETEVTIFRQGVVTFGTNSFCGYYSECPAGGEAYENCGYNGTFLAPLWDELDVDGWGDDTGRVYYRTIGTAPNRRFVVQWVAPHQNLYGDPRNPIDVRMTLFEGSNEIQFCYPDAAFGDPGYDDGDDANISIQLDTGSGPAVLSYSCNQEQLRTDAANFLEFRP